jgi:hypothetical protein
MPFIWLLVDLAVWASPSSLESSSLKIGQEVWDHESIDGVDEKSTPQL